jgi:hypothetical protein
MTPIFNEAGLVQWSDPATVDSLARICIADLRDGNPPLLTAVLVPGVIERIEEIERTEGEQLKLEV